MHYNTTIIIIGATGDLATKNIIPALYELFVDRPALSFSLIGVAQNTITMPALLDKVRPHLAQFDQEKWDLFLRKSHFLAVNLKEPTSYSALAQLVSKAPGNRIIYCACPPQLFIPVVKSCVEQHIITPHDAAHKIVFEKPFGTSLQTAEQLNNELKTLLAENQIIRADHYLAKDLVETVAYLRFTNQIFEPLWNSKHIEYVEITLKESVTVEQRAGLYDSLGVIRDVIQSHAMQLLCLVAMEAPEKLQGTYLHEKKLDILKKTKITHSIFGQYAGYTDHVGVKPHSTTPTYALVTCQIDTPRWQNVPFIIQAGKALDHQDTEIKIVFKQPLCKLAAGCPVSHNQLIIKIAPRGEFGLTINIKNPETDHEIMPVNLNFCYSCMWPYTPQAYRVIFEDLMHTMQSLSVPFTEIKQAWKIVAAAIKEQYPDINLYPVGSTGPQQAIEYLNHVTYKKNL